LKVLTLVFGFALDCQVLLGGEERFRLSGHRGLKTTLSRAEGRGLSPGLESWRVAYAVRWVSDLSPEMAA
jgi:hypothetical protein